MEKPAGASSDLRPYVVDTQQQQTDIIGQEGCHGNKNSGMSLEKPRTRIFS